MHIPVMSREVVEMLAPRKGGIYIDGTVGCGGHAGAILRKIGGEGLLIGIDRDKEALSCAEAVLKPWEGCCRLVHGNFADLKSIAQKFAIDAVDGILYDLGMSSMQVEKPERGFSFMKDGPLDMRMDRSGHITVADIILGASETELARLIDLYGEDPASKKIARAIVIERKKGGAWSTFRLERTVASALGGRRGRVHPATKTFQALRIAVNDELGALGRGLASGLELLAVGGRMAVIAYHSLEDREVKHMFKKHAGHWVSETPNGGSWEGVRPLVKALVKKPLTPSREEIVANRRARSAKMRCVERVA